MNQIEVLSALFPKVMPRDNLIEKCASLCKPHLPDVDPSARDGRVGYHIHRLLVSE
jgi:hypothetical protein